MALRNLRYEGDELLRKKSKEISVVDDKIRTLLNDLVETMYAYDGVGLAAPQVGILKRAVVIDVEDGNIYKMVNPKIIKESGEQIGQEGCLSVPETKEIIRRPMYVTAEYTDENGNQVTLEAEDLLARAICHEIDHLDGILFVDKVKKIGDNMNVIFMGTPEFAVPTLQKLHENGYDIKLVVTQPDKPSGRGKKLKSSEVKEAAEKLGLPVFQPDKIKKQENIEVLKQYNPDVIVVVAYGQILSKEILELPKYGCINVHASLLPKLRGAAPLNWSIINGETHTGVTTMKMDVGLDTGDMLLKAEIIIDENMNVGKLHDILMHTGAGLLIETLDKLKKNEIVPEKQQSSLSSYAPMFNNENRKINWNLSAKNIHNLIRGLSPWPSAYFIMEDKSVKVYESSYINDKTSHESGYVIKADDDGIYVAAGDGIVIIKEFQMPGKNKMKIDAYLRGNKFPEHILLN